MTASLVSPFRRLVGAAAKPFLVRIVAGLLALVLLYGLAGYFILPAVIQSQAQRLIAEKLHRPVSIGKVEVRPFALAVTMRDFRMMEPQNDAVFASFDTLSVDLSAESLWRFAPVVQAARLDKPYVHVVRTAVHRYSIDDLLRSEEPAPAESKGRARFSLNNLQVAGGRIDFEDKPAGARHAIEALDIGVPFISTLPSQVDIFVEPLLAAKVNGSALLFKGKAKPFAANREAQLELNLDGLDLTRFVEYLPFKPAFRLAGARLGTQLVASFAQPLGKAPELTLSGTVDIKSLRLTDPASGNAFLALPELKVSLDRTALLSKQIAVAKVSLNGLAIEASRDSSGQIDLQRLLALASAPAPQKPGTASPDQRAADAPSPIAAPAGQPHANAQPGNLLFKLGELDIQHAAMRFTDRLPAGPMTASVEKFDVKLRGLTVDPAARQVNVSEVASGSADIQIGHDKPQSAAAVAAVSGASAAKIAAAAPASPGTAAQAASKAPGYIVSVGRIAIANWSARLEDRSRPQTATSVLAPIDLTVTGLSTAPSARSRISLKMAANRNGRLALDGTLGLIPLHADLKLDMQALDLLPLQPYVTEHINLLLSRAEFGGKGVLQLDQAEGGELRGNFKGDATLANFATVDKQSGNDFLRWKSLYFGGMDVRLQPLSIAVDQVALSDFFARIIIDPSGRINLQDIVRSHAGDRTSLTEAHARVADTGATRNATAVQPTTAAAAADMKMASADPSPAATRPGAAQGSMPPMKIGKLTLQGGRVRFTDNFVKPNYTANLMGLGGVVSGLSSDPNSSATVDLRGQVNSAPLTVAGSINPLKGDLSMDLQAKVRDMELAPLSPYSGRYIGYGIEKGKLSFDVAYKVDQRKLTAENRLILDQLTFGDKVESPNAASLPVYLAVALLRDRNGVIDLNLPIAGSLEDPQFSVGALIGKVLLNVITKAVTAPFTLLSSLFSGHGEELSYLEFTSGRAAIPAEGEAKLKALAKALTERPQLKLEITAHTGTDAEIEGMKRATIQRKVRALKLKNIEQRGQPAPAGGVEVAPEEYPALLAKVYKDEKFPKPRNMVGLQKDLPVAEMEKLMMANTEVDADDLAALGNRRAQAVKDWLLQRGQIPGERIFILATRTGTPEAKSDKDPSPSRVDFSLK